MALGGLPARWAKEDVHPAEPTELEQLRDELETLRAELADSAEALRAIRYGEVDALVVAAVAGRERVFTLDSADRPYRNFVENMTDGAATVSADGVVTYANQALADLIRTTCQQIVGQPLLELVAPGSRARVQDLVGPSSPGGSIEAMAVRSDGAKVPVRVGSSSVLSINSEDVTCITVTDLTSEHRAEAELAHSAQHDGLTGLLNRTLLTDRIQHALDRRASRKCLIALLFCDVDGLKNINDAYGHQTGDDMLRTVARRLSAAVRPEDTVSRIGGDEFVVVCEGLGTLEDAAKVAHRARDAVAASISSGPRDLEVTVSVGVAVASVDDDVNPETLLRDADEAMYKAKGQGPNVIEVFDEKLRSVTTSRLRLLSEMRHATAKTELRLHYQPILSLATETVVGVEALIRWEHPTQGLVPPDEFIPFAEQSGLITEIGAWVLLEACKQAAAWSGAEGSPALHMSVNVSGRQLAQRAGLVHSLQLALDESGVDPTALILEVTESALMDDAEAALRVMKELKALGVRIAIDDFGTGYSSLVYLKRFPVDLLKVDRSFVDGLGRNKDDAAIVHSVIDLADAFGIDAVAEGIETRRHLGILQELGCAYGQGYLWSAARPAAELGPTLFAPA